MSYEGYSENRKVSAMKYKSEKQKQIALSYKKDDFEQRIQPAIQKSGKPVATFIKEAVEEKLQKDGLLEQ